MAATLTAGFAGSLLANGTLAAMQADRRPAAAQGASVLQVDLQTNPHAETTAANFAPNSADMDHPDLQIEQARTRFSRHAASSPDQVRRLGDDRVPAAPEPQRPHRGGGRK